MEKSSEELLQDLAQVAYDKKGSNLLALDLKEMSALSDYILIVEGNVARHVKAISEALGIYLKENNLWIASLETDSASDWMVIDCYDVIVHIFTADMRKKYALEQFWSSAKIVDLDLKLSNSSV